MKQFRMSVLSAGGVRSTSLQDAEDGFAAVNALMDRMGDDAHRIVAIRVYEGGLGELPPLRTPVVTVEGYTRPG